MSDLACSRIGAEPMAKPGRRDWVLDAVERLSVLLLYTCMVARMPAGLMASRSFGDLMLLVGEGLVVVFFLIRHRTSDISRSPFEWFLAAAATWVPLIVVPGGKEGAILPRVAVAVMLVGVLVQFAAKLTLARSFGMVPANRGLKTSGPYGVVRHPMYGGYFLMQLGFLALNPTWWNAAAYAVCWTLQTRRLMAEERFLGRDPAYREYQARVSYRILPGLF
jgi:protein-S-isoprenylcysteine O-methyltransferase Ste14